MNDGRVTAGHLTAAVSSFLHSRLADGEQRARHSEQCAERLAAGAVNNNDAPYSDQAVLANLDWGIDALEEAIASTSPEARLARLDHADRMLQVAAMLDPSDSTAGVPNSYLAAWAQLHLAYLSLLRGGETSPPDAVLHALEVFDVEPFFARIDFAPELWEVLFLPHMGSVVAWYSESRLRVVMDTIPEPSDLSLPTECYDQLFNELVTFSMDPDQAEKLRELEARYGESLDHNTRMYARYYKELMAGDGDGTRAMEVLPPTVEPPTVPIGDMTGSIPDFVKFGPILPKSAGFSSPIAGSPAHSSRFSPSRLSAIANPAQKSEESARLILKDPRLEEDEDDIESCGSDAGVASEIVTHEFGALNSMISMVDERRLQDIPSPRENDKLNSHRGYSPVDSPRTLSLRVPSPSPLSSSKKEPDPLLCLPSTRSSSTSQLNSASCCSRVSSPEPPKESEPHSHLESSCTKTMAASSHFHDDHIISSAESDDEDLCRSHKSTFSGISNPANVGQNSNLSDVSHNESEVDVSSLPSSERLTSKKKPLKDFVCPITGQVFRDPVTLETGQTFERRAIQEWLERGNTTCPITRQLLSSSVLPKTNYVLKRLVTSWLEENRGHAQKGSSLETPSADLSLISDVEFGTHSIVPTDLYPPFARASTNAVKSDARSKRFTRALVSTSPTSVIAQAASETAISGLKPYTHCLCTSNDLEECEAAVLTIAKTWMGTKSDPGVHDFLSKPDVLNGFVDILSSSNDREALRASIYILSKLTFIDESVGEILTELGTLCNCLVRLLISGLAEAAVLIYQLRPTFSQLCSHSLTPSLVQVITMKGEQLNDFQLVMEPRKAAIALLEQILSGGDGKRRSLNASSVIASNGLPVLIRCLDQMEVRLCVVSILLSCMRADKGCRILIANRAELAPVLELFHVGEEGTRSICIDFLAELVCLNKRTCSNKNLQIIKDEGTFSTMHAFLVYLQMAPMEQQPTVASLLLQLDLLVEPRKMSMFREEAIDAIIEALQKKDFPICQTIALDTLLYLSGRLSASGKPLTEAWLLMIAGVSQPYKTLMTEERTEVFDDLLMETVEEEEKAMVEWEKRVAYVLCNHDNGAMFKALEECLKSNSLEMTKSCLVFAAWLTHMLGSLPDTGIIRIACQHLLDQFINVIQSSRNLEEKVLAALALHSFIRDPDALEALCVHAKYICKPLRKLRGCSILVADTLKAITSMPSIDTTELWSCTELLDKDNSVNGEVLSLVYTKGWVFSSHSDGTIKVWDVGKRDMQLIQEAHEHLKAVTCLHLSSSSDKLYSSSLDKSVRVWKIESQRIHSIQVHDMKETVNCLSANDDLVCFASQGTGAKICNLIEAPKHVNFNKNVKCLAMTQDYLYCGCTGCSIQEVDLVKSTSSTLFSGTRKILGKQTIHALCIHDGILFAGGSSVDGTAGKAFSLSTRTAIGSFSTGFDIHSISVSTDFVFTGTKCGIIEVWLRERLTRVASIKVGNGTSTKVTSLVSDSDGEMIFAGTSDGRIQVWALD